MVMHHKKPIKQMDFSINIIIISLQFKLETIHIIPYLIMEDIRVDAEDDDDDHIELYETMKMIFLNSLTNDA